MILFREETRDGRLPPLDEFDFKKHPRVCRIRDLLGNPGNPLFEILKFNRGVNIAAVPTDGSYVAVDGYSGQGEKRRWVTVYNALTGKELLNIESQKTFPGGTFAIDEIGKTLSYDTDDSGKRHLVEMPSVKPLGTFEQSVATRAALSPGATHWQGHQLYRRGDKNLLLTLDIDYLASTRQQALNTAGTHIAWGNPDGTVMVADINEVQRRLATGLSQLNGQIGHFWQGEIG